MRAATSTANRRAPPTPTPMPKRRTESLLAGGGPVRTTGVANTSGTVWTDVADDGVWGNGVSIIAGGGMVLSNCSTTVGVGFRVVPRLMVLVVVVLVMDSSRSFWLMGSCWAQRRGNGGCRVGGSWERHTSWRVVLSTRRALLSNSRF